MAETGLAQLEAIRLDDVLADGRLARGRALALARQIAEELSAAHKHGVSHGGLTLASIVLLESEAGEQAVVTGFGGHAGTRSDIFAFGQVLEALLPGHRLVDECMALNPNDRPDSFEVVLEELQEFSRGRTWIGSLLIAAAMCGLIFYEVTRWSGRG